MKIVFVLSFLLGMAVSASALEFAADANTVALWHFNEGGGDTLHDASGHGNSGYISGATWVNGIMGKALEFGGYADYVQVPDCPALDMPAGGQLTMEVWARFDILSAAEKEIINKGDPRYNGGGYEIVVHDSKLSLYGFNDSINEGGANVSIGSLNTNVWYYIAGVFQGTVTRLYINGALRAIDTFSTISKITPGLMPLHIGNWDYPNRDRAFDGVIDEIRISDAARGPSEIAAHWEANRHQGSLAAYYPFNGNANDESGNGNHGTVYNAALSADMRQNSNRAYDFNGQNSYISVSPSQTLLAPAVNNEITVCLWAYPRSFHSPQTNYGVVLAKRLSASDFEFQLYVERDGNLCFAFNGQIYDDGIIPNNLELNTWQHLAVTYDGDSLKFFKNGICFFKAANSAGMHTSSGGLVIGKRPDINAEYYDGKLDEIRIYHHALPETDVLDLYQSTLGLVPVLIPVASPTLERRPGLKWYSVDDTSSYRVEIDTAKSFSSPIVSIVVSDTAFRPLADLPMQTVYWRVGTGSPARYSKTDSFFIQNPLVPLLIAYKPDPTRNRRPVLTWHPVSGASSYHIMIDDNGNFTSPGVSLAVSDTLFAPLSDLPYGRIYWKVKSNLYDGYSQAGTFYIQPDTIPFLYAFEGATVAEERPVFKWRPVARASIYKIQIDTTPGFASPMTSINVSDTSFVPLSDLGNGLYFWRVSCDLNFNAFSAVDSVEIDTGFNSAQANGVPGGAEFTVYPTPFNPATNIYFPNHYGRADIYIYSVNGKNVAAFKGIGQNQVRWNAASCPSGIYIVMVNTGGRVYRKRICLIK